MKVIFMGTPQFSCETLQKLIDDKQIDVVAVYTKEPQIAGRGHRLQKSAIHQLAEKNNIKVLTPKTLRKKEVQEEFSSFNADIAVVVAYGLILPKEILNAPKFGCVNIHPSALPKWRGAAPLQRTIMNGDKETAICIIQMNEGLDSGDIIVQEKFVLHDKITYQELAQKTASDGARILLETLKNIKNGNFSLTPQDDKLATYAHKLDKQECEIDFNSSAQKIEQKIRALSGNLGAYFVYNGENIKVFAAEIIDEKEEVDESKIGKIIDDKLTIQCKIGKIRPLLLQRSGKRVMNLDEFLRGFNFRFD